MKLIHPGQYAVFLSEARTGLPRDREGRRFASDDEACVAIGFVAADFARDLRWIWGYIVGVKCMLVDGAFLVRGLVGLYEYRGESQQSTIA
jgi:hypothetical protein